MRNAGYEAAWLNQGAGEISITSQVPQMTLAHLGREVKRN